MKKNTGSFALLLAWLVLQALPATADVDAAAAQIHQRKAFQAYRDGDLAGYTSALEDALVLNPYSLPTRYNLACGYARTGRGDQAMETLRDLVAVGADYGIAEDEDFTSLRERPGFRQLLGDLEDKTRTVNSSVMGFKLEELGLIPEGIAHDEATGRFFLGSMRSGAIYVIDDAGQLSKFATVQYQGKMAAIGLAIERRRGILWAVGATFDFVEEFDPQAATRSGIFGFDLVSGELRHQFLASNPVNGFNDVAVAPSGDVYISGDALSVVRAGASAITALDTSIKIHGSNGIAVRPDGKRLFVSSYPVGIAAVDPASGEASWLETPDHLSLYGIDGLYWHEGELIGVQNGISPWRLVKLRLNAAETAVTGVHVIELGNDNVTATTGVIIDNAIHYVGQGPAPEPPPSQFPESMAQFTGKTFIMSAPLQ